MDKDVNVESGELKYWFSIPIYVKDNLNPPEEIYNRMISYFHRYHRKVEASLISNVTGDVTGNYMLFNNEIFYWLNDKIAEHIKEYFEMLDVDVCGITAHIQKSWPVVCNNGGQIGLHIHSNAHFSAVYYLQTESNNDTGCLHFIKSYPSPTDCIPLNIGVTGYKNEENLSMVGRPLLPLQGRLVIFPSNTGHYVNEYIGKIPRYSVSYDLMVTTKDRIPNNNEMMTLHPTFWKEIL
jgi:uncharacterized protein (TIGR02466 family)